jgi:hypothetical protein
MEEKKNLSAEQAGIPPKQPPEKIPAAGLPQDYVSGEEAEQSKTSTEETISSEENILPQTESIETTNTENQNDMEVHHHAHNLAEPHHKKNWKAYFWEFLMLFLAVFCGFLAEYQLEHKIERDRANELAKSFYEELKNDSIAVSNKVKERIRQEDALVYLEKYFRDSSLTDVSKTFVLNFSYGIYFRSLSLFEPRTVVFEQLKNSGSLRYFKNDELQKLISDLSVAIHNIADRQALETQLRLDYVNPVILKHYDYAFEDLLTDERKLDVFTAIKQYEKSDEVIPFHLHSLEKFNREEMVNLVGFYGRAGLASTRRIHYQRYIELNAELLKILQREYRLK